MRVLRMIKSEQLAATLSAKLLDVFRELEGTIGLVADEAEEDLQCYRQAIGSVCGSLVLDVLGPLYEAHPQVKPASWNEGAG
jgi:hypothetical protein